MTGLQGLHAVRVEGGILPATLFQHIQANDIGEAASRTPSSYHLAGRESIRDAASRSWTYLIGAWQSWREAQSREPGGSAGTGASLARERWLLVLLQELGYGRLPAHTGGLAIGEQTYPVSHLWQRVPIHLLGPGVDLDRRNPGVAGATRAPQAMLQELLNRSDEYLWALLSNGLRLRVLRDSTALAGSAFIEFDLEAMFDGELFAEFLLLWQVCHQSRLEARADGDAERVVTQCWLETWRSDSVTSGARALDKLRGGVEDALTHLGGGFLAHPHNTALRDALTEGRLSASDYHRHLLRTVYRLLFLFVIEDRGVLHDPDAPEQARTRYDTYLSTRRLRALARQRQGSASYADLWQGQRLVLGALGGDGLPGLGLPALGGLFDPAPGGDDPVLEAELSNDAYLAALRDLAWIQLGSQRMQPVDYRNLGAEELGGVYEALLELVPQVSVHDRTFTYARLSGNERKTTGSYYTPPALVSALLDTALDPVIDAAVSAAADAADAQRRLLELTVCDPACGSGHFLVAAARRIAQRLAALRSGEDEPTPTDVRHALRDVVGRCVYGVDLNPLAAELAKVSLWLEAIEPGRALGFLDARIRVGNSLLGTTPSLLAAGVPDGAFKPLEGDDKATVSAAKKRNARERGAFGLVQDQLELDIDDGASTLAQARSEFLTPQSDVAAVRQLTRHWRTYEESRAYLDQKVHADSWTAAFVWPYSATRTNDDGTIATPPNEPTSAVVRRFSHEPGAAALRATRAAVEHVAEDYRFFHWHLEFPEVFQRETGTVGDEGWTGGFDAVLGNPPWERVKLQEQEFFAARDPEIATAPNAAARRRLIAALEHSESAAERSLHREFLAARRRAEGESAILRVSGRYPLAGRGDVNTYAVFTELFRTLTGPTGQAGIIVPTGIATDATTQYFFKDVVQSKTLAALFDFENRAPLFVGVDSRFKFCLLTLTGRAIEADAATFAFFLHDPRDIEATRFALTPEEINLLNPNTGTLPIFRTRRDAEINVQLSSGLPVVWSETVASIGQRTTRFSVLSDLDKAERLGVMTRLEPTAEAWFPIYEAKLFHQYNHRFAEYRELAEDVTRVEHVAPNSTVTPRAWLASASVKSHFGEDWPRWVVAYRDIARNTDTRTMIAAVLPSAAGDYTVRHLVANWQQQPYILANYNSLAFDYIVRSRNNGTHLSDYLIYQCPVVVDERLYGDCPWAHGLTIAEWMAPRILELSFTTADLRTFAAALGDEGDPFAASSDRRRMLEIELDAAFFILYNASEDSIEFIFDSFPRIADEDSRLAPPLRRRTLTLDAWRRMMSATTGLQPYTGKLDPPPGEGPRHPSTLEIGAPATHD